MEKSAPAAMARVTRGADSWAALAPMADTADILAGWIGQKYVSAFISALSVTFQPSPRRRQRREIGVIIYNDQNVRVLWVVFGCRQ